jgi:hypothetical protein
MREFDVELKGISPLLMHAMRANLEENRRKTGSSETNDPKDCLYELPNGGGIYVPAQALYAAMVKSGGNFQVRGRGKKTYSTLFAGALTIEPDAILITPQEWVVDERTVVIPSTKGRTLRRRPKWPEWKLRFKLRVSEDQIAEDVVKQALDYAGSMIGILDYRPEKKGPFGRFIVTRFEALNGEKR